MTFLRGVDESHWQSSTIIPAGAVFGFAKASEGTTTDDRFVQHLTDFRRANLELVGAYGFARKDVNVTSQALFFTAAARDADVLAVDNEATYKMGLTQLTDFIGTIKAVDQDRRKVLLYMSDGSFLEAGQDGNWVAKWSLLPPARQWVIWQYNGSPLDLDYFHGTIDDLRALKGATMPALPIEITPTPRRMDLPSPLTFFDMSGNPQGDHGGGQQGVYSPFRADKGTSSFYAMYARNADGTNGLILVKPAATPVVIPTPVLDCTAAVQKAVADQKTADAAVLLAAVKAQVAADAVTQASAVAAIVLRLNQAKAAIKAAAAAVANL